MRKLLIVSSDDYILYQPTVLNLYDYLEGDFEVTVINFEPRFLGRKKDAQRRVIYLSLPEWKRRLCRVVDLCVNAVLKRIDWYIRPVHVRSTLVRQLRARVLRGALQRAGAADVIAVDSLPLYVAQQVYERCHFLSLEIIPNDPFMKKADMDRIASVVIQTEDRYRFLFHDRVLPVFYIQNAPFCKNIYYNRGPRKGLVWAGSIVKEFAVFRTLDFVRSFPDYRLVLKGAADMKTRPRLLSAYGDLLQSGQVVMDENYLSAQDYIRYLSQFSIGFCFYGWDLIQRNFNYQTAPSGKLFMYLAAGVPVIACNIPAFRFLETDGAGVLVDDYEPQTIYAAIKRIEADYDRYRERCYAAATRFCFDTNAAVFKSYLLNQA
ncbi:MAG TPA: hypothetical protein VLD19_00975 [Chitinophagaceae bacterium]|nr:hypothetical protein [Chitinophagaceae bacterium]